MGLETWASHGPRQHLTKADIAAFADAHVRLCECDGDPSFRGKVYTWLVQQATGESLPYEGEWTEPDIVRRMADALETADPDEVALRVGEPVEDVTCSLVELARFFRVCADRGLGLRGA